MENADTAHFTAFAQIGGPGVGSLWLLIEEGIVIEAIEARKDTLDGFADRIAGYLDILGMDPARVVVSPHGAGAVLLKRMESKHGMKLTPVSGCDPMRRADMTLIGLD